MPNDVARATAAALLEWWPAGGRDLPWRRTRDPWSVLVSELMLQQTQVTRVVPKYRAFLDRFPTLAECAAAPVGDVVTMWAGLGYNRRAINLHDAARACVDRHEGRLPDSLDDLLALPGIGPYTARAVLAFAFGRDVGVLDVNARRVLARAFGVASQAGADALVPPGAGWMWNQAVLDVGATTCTRRRPTCGNCPLAATCVWRGGEAGEPDPAPHPTRQPAFAGSDRQGRGRLVDALRGRAVPSSGLAAVMGWPDDATRAERVAATLVRDRLVLIDADGTYRLPR